MLSDKSDYALNTVQLVKFRNSVTQPQPTSHVSDQARDKKAPYFLESWVVLTGLIPYSAPKDISGPSLNSSQSILIHLIVVAFSMVQYGLMI